ncbi:MAG: hypothetical protein QNJ38_02575 [Prochloraceae cyanobacterium]|nr:hypothetical protein [Prochloraceae cyanobacterium]
MKYLALLLLFNLYFGGFFFADKPTLCRQYNDREVCIFNLKRSAKHFWEYRAVVSVDGNKRPLEIYNCRDKIRLEKDGTVLSFIKNDPGNVICSYFQR